MLKTAFLTVLALQTCLDRRGFSPNTMDGQYGTKTHAALCAYCEAKGLPAPAYTDTAPAYEIYFPGEPPLLTTVEVTAEDIASLTNIPYDPAAKAKLPRMGYESLQEMFAERGHVTRATLARLNPGIDWKTVKAGTRITLPEVSPAAVDGKAALVRVSLSKFTVTALDAKGKPMAMFPCSIAKDRAKRPPPGEIRIVTNIENPNYTYTPDFVPPGGKVSRHVFPPGPNNPVGTVWLGLSLPGYGIHGTPLPERIGRAESHGCFRLANWNVSKLYELVSPGTRVIVEP